MYTVLSTFCKSFSTLPNTSNTVVSTCYTNLFWYGVLVFVAGIVYTIAVITSVGDLRVGAVLYAIGFAIGFAFLYI